MQLGPIRSELLAFHGKRSAHETQVYLINERYRKAAMEAFGWAQNSML
jgi:hypothetical protein